MRYPYIAFDIDGTLVDSEFSCLQSFRDTLEELTGVVYTNEELAFSQGIPGLDALKRMDLPDIPRAFQLWRENQAKYRDTITIFPGISELLEELIQQGCTLGLVTSQTREEYEEGFAHLPIAHYFTIPIRADDASGHKPTPAPLLRFMELAGCKPSQLLYIGDRESDLRCARGAGVDFALAGWGNPTEQLQVDYRLEKPEDLLRHL